MSSRGSFQPKPTLFQRFRRNGIRQTKSMMSSIADIVSDWIFYLNVKSDTSGTLEKYEIYLFIFACVSSGMGVLLLLSFVLSVCSSDTKNRGINEKFAPFGAKLKLILGLEILVEDIPQFVLGALITNDLGRMTPYVIFTLTTSAFNFLFNLLDMIEIEDDGVSVEEDENVHPQAGVENTNSTRASDRYTSYANPY